jgi:hypothetical protein
MKVASIYSRHDPGDIVAREGQVIRLQVCLGLLDEHSFYNKRQQCCTCLVVGPHGSLVFKGLWKRKGRRQEAERLVMWEDTWVSGGLRLLVLVYNSFFAARIR